MHDRLLWFGLVLVLSPVARGLQLIMYLESVLTVHSVLSSDAPLFGTGIHDIATVMALQVREHTRHKGDGGINLDVCESFLGCHCRDRYHCSSHRRGHNRVCVCMCVCMCVCVCVCVCSCLSCWYGDFGVYRKLPAISLRRVSMACRSTCRRHCHLRSCVQRQVCCHRLLHTAPSSWNVIDCVRPRVRVQT